MEFGATPACRTFGERVVVKWLRLSCGTSPSAVCYVAGGCLVVPRVCGFCSLFAGGPVLAPAGAYTYGTLWAGLGWAHEGHCCFSGYSGLHPCPGRGLAEKEASALVLSLLLQPLGHEAQADAFGEGPPQQALGGPCPSLLKSVIFLSRQFLDQHGGFQHRHQRHHV